MTKNLEVVKKELLAQIEKRVNDGIIESANATILNKLISRAEDVNEAIAIATLGTTYKRTGFHFDARYEKTNDNTIKYFKKNDELSFQTSSDSITHKLIIGDNYQALQNLLIEYKKCIDVIYIDPPYGKDSMGEFAETNYDNSLTRDNLLSMLYPRLILAKQLLSDEGVIFCSIDDKNQAYLKCLLDEIFDERNFICNFVWEKTQHFGRQKINFYNNVDYVLCYAKQKHYDSKIKELLVERVKTELEDAPLYNASNPIKKLLFPKGSVKFNIKDGIYDKTTDCKYVLHNPVEVKNGFNANDFELSFPSRWARQTVLEEIEKGTIYWVKTNNFAIRAIYNDGRESKESPKQIIFTNSNNEFVTKDRNNVKVGTNEDGSSALFDIMNIINIFDYPKAPTLISYLVSLTNKKDAKILDFFAGSGTTGQAVLELNKEDGGSRQFILAQLNEITETTPNGIVYDVLSKRLKRIMTGECYDGTKDFGWITKNKPFGDNLDVYDIASVSNASNVKDKTPFDVIDETLYGKKKFKTVKEKIEWVIDNFEHTQIILTEKKENVDAK